MDGLASFNVQTEVPAGAAFAALEAGNNGSAWRTKLVTPLDGRRARVTFRLPCDPSVGNAMARIRTGVGTAPVADLPGAAHITVVYEPQVISEQARLDWLNTAGVRMAEWRDLSTAQRRANLVAWAKTGPLVADAVASALSDSAVLVKFRDGEISTLYWRRRVEDVTGPAGPPAPQLAARKSGGINTLGEVSKGVPGTRNAVCAFSLEPNIFPNSAPTISGWLGGAGYQTRTFGSTTMDEIITWSSGQPLGVLFWQAHGTPYSSDGELGGLEGLSIVTRQEATAAGRLGKFSAYIRRGEVGMAKDDSGAGPGYTITSKFVRNYLRFAPHSLVMLDVCQGAHRELTNAFIESGAGAVGAWDILSGRDSATPMLKVFDRLLGTNAEPPLSFPKERPFALPVIQHWLRLRGFDVDPSPKWPGQKDFNARLVWNMNPGKPADILRPSIMRILYEGAGQTENYTKLLIEGDFGDDPGAARRRLTWGGQPVSLLHWKSDGITIRLPDAKPSGHFQATIDSIHRSNERPCTEWRIPITYTHNARGSLNFGISMNVRMRADIAGTRGMPEMPVQYLPVDFWQHTDCTGSIAAGGSYSPRPKTIITWSGGSDLRSLDPQVQGSELASNAIVNSGRINLLTGEIEDYQLMGGGNFTESVTDQSPQTVNGVTNLFSYPPLTPRINLGSHVFVGNSLSLVLPDGAGSIHASWPAVTPIAAPSPETVR